MATPRKKSAPPALARASEKKDERVRSWLGHYGAPLLVAAHLGPDNVPSPEKTLVDGLRLAHRDGIVAEVLPVVLWHRRQQLDFAKLALLAKRWAKRSPSACSLS
jgi:hypothetical protein